MYSYTGWMNTIAFATSDWNGSAYVKPICDKYNAFANACGFDPANHAIATAYDDREANIGFHYMTRLQPSPRPGPSLSSKLA